MSKMGLLQILPYIGSGQVTGSGGGGSFTPLIGATIKDDGYYNGFPFPYQLMSDGTIICIYKKSADHASKGPMMLAKSLNGGLTWSETQITISSTAIECAALSVGLLSDERIIIGYQDNTLYTSMKFAYSNDKGLTWTASSTTLTNGSGFSFSPIKMLIMPSGKVLCGYYTGYNAGTSEIGFYQTTDEGQTWTQGPIIFTHGGTGFGDNNGYEFGAAIINNTGTDSTCTLLALVRNADVAPYMHYVSTDGGTTWTTDTVTVDNPGAYNRHYLYNFGGFTSQAPCDIIVHNSLVYVVTGLRDATNGYALQYITASIADAQTNNFYNWSTVTTVLTAAINDVHFGYPLCFHDYQGKLWAHYYDVSPLTNNGLGTPRCLIKQVKIAD